ncbi:MAG TPA: ABC transporter ATP-binding protein [Pantanalinema sp.]
MEPLLRAAFTMRHPGFELAFELGLSAGITALMGPSGSGKTTAIRCLAGLARPEAGAIRWGDEVWLDAARGVFVPVEKRRIGFVFKDFALFPHMTVWENIRYGARGRGRGRDLLEMLRISHLADRRPAELSAGQQQRVAIARAIASEPRLLLMDEPFSSLDPPLKRHLLAEVSELVRRTGIPTLVVTHDLEEASALADEIAVLAGGRILQVGPVRTVMTAPQSPEVARLVGIRNCFEGGDGEPDWCVRSDRLVLSAPGDEGADRVLLTVQEVVLEAGGIRIQGRAAGFDRLEVRVPLSAIEGPGPAIGDTLGLRIPPEAIHRFARCRD